MASSASTVVPISPLHVSYPYYTAVRMGEERHLSSYFFTCTTRFRHLVICVFDTGPPLTSFFTTSRSRHAFLGTVSLHHRLTHLPALRPATPLLDTLPFIPASATARFC